MDISNLVTHSTLDRLRDKRASRNNSTFETEHRQEHPLSNPSTSGSKQPHASSRDADATRSNTCDGNGSKRKYDARINTWREAGGEQSASENESAILPRKGKSDGVFEVGSATQGESLAKRRKQVEADEPRQPSADDDRAPIESQDENRDINQSSGAGRTFEPAHTLQKSSGEERMDEAQMDTEERVDSDSTWVDENAATIGMETSEDELVVGSDSKGKAPVKRREQVEVDGLVQSAAENDRATVDGGVRSGNTIRGNTTEPEPEILRSSECKVVVAAQNHATIDGDRKKDSKPTSIFRDEATPSFPSVTTVACPPVEEYFTVSFQRKVGSRQGRRKAGNRRGPRCHFARTKVALSNGVKPWQQLIRLNNVKHAGEDYRLGDVVYIHTDDEADSTARIRDIRESEDGRGRKEICISWLWTKEQANKDCKDTSQWPPGATHIDSNWLQVLPWDTIDGRPTKADVRTLPRPSVVLDACSTEYKIHSWNDPAVEWVSR